MCHGIIGIVVEIHINRAVQIVQSHLGGIKGNRTVGLIDLSAFYAGNTDSFIGAIHHHVGRIILLAHNKRRIIRLEDNGFRLVQRLVVAVDVVVVHIHRDLQLGRTPHGIEEGISRQSHLLAGAIVTSLGLGVGRLIRGAPTIEHIVRIFGRRIHTNKVGCIGQSHFLANSHNDGIVDDIVVMITIDGLRGISPHSIQRGILVDRHFSAGLILHSAIGLGSPTGKDLLVGSNNAFGAGNIDLEARIVHLALGHGAISAVEVVLQRHLGPPHGEVLDILAQGDLRAGESNVVNIGILGLAVFRPAVEALAGRRSQAILARQDVLGVGLGLVAGHGTLAAIGVEGDLHFRTPNGIVGLVAVLAGHIVAGSIIGAVQIIGISSATPAIEHLALGGGEAIHGHGEVRSIGRLGLRGAIVAIKGYGTGGRDNIYRDSKLPLASILQTALTIILEHRRASLILRSRESYFLQNISIKIAGLFLLLIESNKVLILPIALILELIIIVYLIVEIECNALTLIQIVFRFDRLNKFLLRFHLPHGVESIHGFLVVAHGVGSTGGHHRAGHSGFLGQIFHGVDRPANQYTVLLLQTGSCRQVKGRAFLDGDAVHSAFAVVQVEGDIHVGRQQLPHGVQSMAFIDGIFTIIIGRNSFGFTQIALVFLGPAHKLGGAGGIVQAAGQGDVSAGKGILSGNGVILQVVKHDLHRRGQNLPGSSNGGFASDGDLGVGGISLFADLPGVEFLASRCFERILRHINVSALSNGSGGVLIDSIVRINRYGVGNGRGFKNFKLVSSIGKTNAQHTMRIYRLRFQREVERFIIPFAGDFLHINSFKPILAIIIQNRGRTPLTHIIELQPCSSNGQLIFFIAVKQFIGRIIRLAFRLRYIVFRLRYIAFTISSAFTRNDNLQILPTGIIVYIYITTNLQIVCRYSSSSQLHSIFFEGISPHKNICKRVFANNFHIEVSLNVKIRRLQSVISLRCSKSKILRFIHVQLNSIRQRLHLRLIRRERGHGIIGLSGGLSQRANGHGAGDHHNGHHQGQDPLHLSLHTLFPPVVVVCTVLRSVIPPHPVQSGRRLRASKLRCVPAPG